MHLPFQTKADVVERVRDYVMGLVIPVALVAQEGLVINS